jgi:hypothetical protein
MEHGYQSRRPLGRLGAGRPLPIADERNDVVRDGLELEHHEAARVLGPVLGLSL